MEASVEGFQRILDCLVVGGLAQLAEIIAAGRTPSGASTDGVARYLLAIGAPR
jgi:hypothetical protein